MEILKIFNSAGFVVELTYISLLNYSCGTNNILFLTGVI